VSSRTFLSFSLRYNGVGREVKEALLVHGGEKTTSRFIQSHKKTAALPNLGQVNGFAGHVTIMRKSRLRLEQDI